MTNEYKSIVETYIYEGLTRDITKVLQLVEQGEKCSPEYLETLQETYNFFQSFFGSKPDIEKLLDQLQEKNRLNLKNSLSVIRGNDTKAKDA